VDGDALGVRFEVLTAVFNRIQVFWACGSVTVLDTSTFRGNLLLSSSTDNVSKENGRETLTH
jgi:hypothetical protein